MRKYIPTMCFVAFLLTGCYTQRKAQRQFNNAVLEYPDIGVRYCAANFLPNTDTLYYETERLDTLYLPGTDVFIDCDTVKTYEVLRERPRLVKVPCPPVQTVVKTIVQTKVVEVENKAKIKLLETDIITRTRRTKLWACVAGISMALAIGVFLYFKIFKNGPNNT